MYIQNNVIFNIVFTFSKKQNPEISVERQSLRHKCSPLFPFRTERRKLLTFFIGNFSTFQSLFSLKQLRELEFKMVSAFSFGWFADFGRKKTFPIFKRSSQPVASHPDVLSWEATQPVAVTW